MFSTLTRGQSLFSDADMNDPDNWAVSAYSIDGPFDYQANWGVSYLSALGVPQDPFSSSTTALQLKVNETSGSQTGVSASPYSLSVCDNYVLTFDMWLNYNSGGFTAGSTQIGSFGLTQNIYFPQWAGVGGGSLYGISTDNGTSVNYRNYDGGVNLGASPTVAGSQNYANPYYTTLFPSVNVPGTETALNPNQYGSTADGIASFQWVQVTLAMNSGVLSESLNGTPIASFTPGAPGSDIFLGLYDVNDGSAGVTGLDDENFVLFDNVQVTAAPEPTTWALLAGAGILGLIFNRRARIPCANPRR
jgi:hypothetical protein